MRGDGPLADPSLLADGQVPAPSGHAPRLEALVDKGAVGLRIRERDGDAWIHAGKPAEVRR